MAISFYPLIKRALQKELRNAPEINLAYKVIIISDLPLGLKDGADQFKQCEETLLYALKVYANKGTADAKLVNTDGKNGGWTGATVVSE